jgi:hypothetical protein
MISDPTLISALPGADAGSACATRGDDMSKLPTISEAEFDVLCKGIPVALSAEEKSGLYRIYAHLEEMRRLVRKPRSHVAEPAHIFVPSEKGAFDAG